MIGMIKVTIISSMVSALVFSVASYYHGRSVGINQASVECLGEKGSLIQALNEATRKNVELVNKQRDSYRVALDMRNARVQELEAGLTEAETEIRRMMNESEDACVNAPIPDDFK
jgi:hypothetical protein